MNLWSNLFSATLALVGVIVRQLEANRRPASAGTEPETRVSWNQECDRKREMRMALLPHALPFPPPVTPPVTLSASVTHPLPNNICLTLFPPFEHASCVQHAQPTYNRPHAHPTPRIPGHIPPYRPRLRSQM